MYTLTLASIYEGQGLEDEALSIYRKVLQNDPSNNDARVAIRRLSGMRKKFLNKNVQMTDFFVNMDTEIEFTEFERWLLKTWN